MQTIGEYELLEKIAEGGMGTVHKARKKGSADLVAIKVLPAHLAKNPVLLKRFEQEYNAAKLLDHANIVRALDFGYHGNSPYLVMEYVDGESLGARLERLERLPETEAIKLIAQVAQGLHKAHKLGLVHRDVKPDNILITPDGQAKLTDMGLVKEMETDLNLTRTGRGLGTPHFMAPEQFRNAKNADVRCDIYSLAATLYMMVTGELPFKSLGPLEAWMKKVENNLTAPRDVLSSLSERIDWAIRRSMHSDPNQRPSDCREFIEDLTGRSTRRLPTLAGKSGQDKWVLRYRDDEGVSHSITASLASIRRSLKDGYLGDAANIRAARTSNGPFEPIRNFPELRDIVMGNVFLKTAAEKSTDPPAVNGMKKQKNTAQAKPVTGQPSPARSVNPQSPLNPDAAPQINLPTTQDSGEWGRYVFLVLMALLAGAGGYFLFRLVFP